MHDAYMSNLCTECGMPEGQCFSICPTQDPYAGDQATEESDYSFGARYDRWDGYDAGDAYDCNDVAPVYGPIEAPSVTYGPVYVDPDPLPF
jgi:hypothetical protein